MAVGCRRHGDTGTAGAGPATRAAAGAGAGAPTPAAAAHARGFAGTAAALVVLLAAAVLVALCVGRYAVSPAEVAAILFGGADADVSDASRSVVEVLRLPRVVAAVLVGAALALAGATYQGIFKNPLVSPDLLGVSSGACVGAALAIVLGMGMVAVQGMAFAGGIVAVGLTVAMPRLMRTQSTLSLVLAGVVTSGFMNALVGLLKYLADTQTQLPDIVYWQLGSLTKVGYDDLLLVAPVMVVAGAVLLLMGWRVNLLSLGERESRSLGVEVGRERMVAIVCSTLLTACAVCLSGTIGWIGLVVPHLARLVVGSDNTRVLPASALLSATFLLVVDTLSRTLTGSEIPLGILTGVIGAPCFAVLLVRNRKAR